jgi:glycosyltransferase involved in cell wall biosynthesis
MPPTSSTRSCKPAANTAPLLASVIVNNYNYGIYLPQAIDSALGQTYPHLEVIVVDDGSTDDSREIISRYESRIRSVLKSNGGQASALNAGFAASHGDVVLFLDADDFLYPSAVANAVDLFCESEIAKVHWPLAVIDGNGMKTGATRPSHALPEGDFRQQVLERGPSNVASAPTSGNAWSGKFLKRVLPIPEDVAYYRLCADEYLYTLAPVFGLVRTIPQPQGCYRIHGDNVYSSRSFRQKLDLELSGYDGQCRALSAALARNGMTVDVDSWKQHSWFHRLDRAISDIVAAVPQGSEFVLVDGNTWGAPREFVERRLRPFLELDGMDGGPPADDEAAIRRLTTLLADETQFLVVAWPCFWWFDEYAGWSKLLRRAAGCVLSNDVVAIFDLDKLRAAPAVPIDRDSTIIAGGGLDHA